MADINVERKRGPNWLPILIGLIVLGLLAWLLLNMLGDDDATDNGDGTPTDTAAVSYLAPPPPPAVLA